MTLKFRYSILPDKFSNDTKKPVIRLTLNGNNQSPIDVLALLDSGADISVIPKGLAEYLNLKLENKSTSKGIVGEINIWNSFVHMSLHKGHENYNLLHVPIQVAEDDSIPIILGRAGFFDKFEIIIDEHRQQVKLKRNNKLK